MIARKEKIVIAETAWPLLRDEAARLRETPIEQGTALDTAGNGRFARKVIVHCKHERARRLSTTPPQLLAQAAASDLVVNDDDMRRAVAAASLDQLVVAHLEPVALAPRLACRRLRRRNSRHQ